MRVLSRIFGSLLVLVTILFTDVSASWAVPECAPLTWYEEISSCCYYYDKTNGCIKDLGTWQEFYLETMSANDRVGFLKGNELSSGYITDKGELQSCPKTAVADDKTGLCMVTCEKGTYIPKGTYTCTKCSEGVSCDGGDYPVVNYKSDSGLPQSGNSDSLPDNQSDCEADGFQWSDKTCCYYYDKTNGCMTSLSDWQTFYLETMTANDRVGFLTEKKLSSGYVTDKGNVQECPKGTTGDKDTGLCTVTCQSGSYVPQGEYACTKCPEDETCSGGSYPVVNYKSASGSMPRGDSEQCEKPTKWYSEIEQCCYYYDKDTGCVKSLADWLEIYLTLKDNEWLDFVHDQGLPAGYINEDGYLVRCPDSPVVTNAETGRCELTCAAGTYVSSGKMTCDPCLNGYYCVGGTAILVNYSDDQGMESCPANWPNSGGTRSARTDCTRTVYFDKNGGTGTINGTGGTTAASKTCNYNTACSITSPTNALTLTGYTFPGGWGTANTCSAATPTAPKVTSTASTAKVYACKAGITYSLHFNNTCPGTPGGAISNQTIIYDSNATFPANGFTCTGGSGYSFQGYSRSSTGSAEFGPGQNASTLTSVAGDTVEMYALWAPVVAQHYTITLNDNGGTGGNGAVYTTYGVGSYTDSTWQNQMTTSANPVAVPTKTNGYAFLGYYDTNAQTGGHQIIDANGYVTADGSTRLATYSGNETIWARWSSSCYVIPLNTTDYCDGTGRQRIYTDKVSGSGVKIFLNPDCTSEITESVPIPSAELPGKTNGTFVGYYTVYTPNGATPMVIHSNGTRDSIVDGTLVTYTPWIAACSCNAGWQGSGNFIYASGGGIQAWSGTCVQGATVTLDTNSGGSGGSEAVYTNANGVFTNMTRTTQMGTGANGANPISTPTAGTTGYNFQGYFSAATGGTSYIDSTGHLTTAGLNAATAYTANQTWYAHWDLGTITCSAGQYLPAGSTTCATCLAGYSCPAQSVSYTFNATNAQGLTMCVGRTKYSAAGATSCSTVTPGYYTTGCSDGNGGTGSNACTGQSQCTGATWCASGIQNNCDTGYTANTTAGKTARTQCQIQCNKGQRVRTVGGTCTSDANPWFITTSQTVNYGDLSPVSYCMNDVTNSWGYKDASTSSSGHDEATDCTIIVNAGYGLSAYLGGVTAVKIANTAATGSVMLAEIRAYNASNAANSLSFNANNSVGVINPVAATNGSFIDGQRTEIGAGRYGVWNLANASLSKIQIGFAQDALVTDVSIQILYNGVWHEVVASNEKFKHTATILNNGGQSILFGGIPDICAAGKYQDTSGASGLGTSRACSNVNAGYYTTGGGTSATPGANGAGNGSNGCLSGKSCGVIAAGYYGAAGATSSTGSGPVSGGYYSTGGGKSATPSSSDCVSGNSCGLLDAPYYSNGGSTSNGATCVSGKTCGTCDANYRANSTGGKTAVTQCQAKIILDKNGGTSTSSIGGTTGATAGSVYCNWNTSCTFDSASSLTQGGYSFPGGWGTDAACTTGSTTFTNNPYGTYYACKTTNSYTISYNLNSGAWGDNANHPATYIVTDAFTISNPVRQGYTFNGWTVTTAPTAWGTGSSSSGATNFTVAAGTYGNIALSATWSEGSGVAYTVKHYTKNTTGSSYTLHSTDNLTGTTNAQLTLANLTKAITGFTYDAGFVGDNGTTKPSSGATTTTQILADGTLVIDLYYNRNTYNISYNLANGYMPVDYLMSDGTNYIETGIYPDLTKNIKVIGNLYNPSATGNKSAFSNYYSNSTTPVLAAFIKNGGKALFSVGNATGTLATSAAALPLNTLLSYSIDYIAAQHSAVIGINGETLNIDSIPEYTNASSKPMKFFLDNRSDLSIIAHPVGIGATSIIQDGKLIGNFVPVRDSGATCGLYDIASGYYYKNASGMNPFTCPAGSAVFPTSYTYGVGATINGTPIRGGYTFAGWTGGNGSTVQTTATIGTSVTGNKTYTANWTPIDYTISYDLDGGEWGTGITHPTSYTVETNTFTISNPMRSGYIFDGWTIVTAPTTWGTGSSADGAISFKVGKGTYGDIALKATWTKNSYTITVNAGAGVSTVAGSGWTNTGTATMTKDYEYGTQINLASVVTPTRKNGFTGTAYALSSGAGTLDGTTFTVGAGAATITVNATGLTAPTAADITITGGETKTYNQSDTTLSAGITGFSTSYDSGVAIYYAFGYTSYSSSTCGTTYTYGGNAGTLSELLLSKTAFRGSRCYKVKVYLVGDGLTSATVESDANTLLRLLQRKITFNVNGGTLVSGSSAAYARYNSASLYTSSTSNTTTTVPSASKVGYEFGGWWTDASAGEMIYDSSLALTSEQVSGFTNNGLWVPTATKTVYAHWIPRNDTAYTVKHYTKNANDSSYTLHSTDNLTGTTDVTLTLANLKKTITGFTYDQGFAGTATNGTTKPSSGAVTTTTILADGTRVIDLYYNRNLYNITYTPNGGNMVYVPVEYIENPSTAYIDTGIRANNHMRAEAEFMRTSTKDSAVFGNYNDGQSGSTFMLRTGTTSTSSPVAPRIWNGGSQSFPGNSTFGNPPILDSARWYTVVYDVNLGNVVVTDDNGASISLSFNASDFTTTHTIPLFTRIISDGSLSYYMVGKMKYFSLYENGLLRFNGVPVRVQDPTSANNNRCGFYDTVSGNFFGSASNVEFRCPDVVGFPAQYAYGTTTVVAQPLRANSVFEGWCTNSNLTNCSMSQTISATATGDKVFYAKWSCQPGYSPNSGNTACVSCPSNYYCTGGLAAAQQCPANLSTPNDNVPAYHDEAGDCGRKLHIGNDVLWLRSAKKTTKAMNFDFFGNDGVADLFLNLSTSPAKMSSGKKFKMNYGGTVYYGCDDVTCQ